MTFRRRDAMYAGLLLAGSFLGACGSSSPLIVGAQPDPGAGPFAGTWSLSGTATQSVESDGGPVMMPMTAPTNVRLRIADGTGSSMAVTILSDTGSGPECLVAATRRGSTATLVAGSSCTIAMGTTGTLTVRSGTLSLEGPRLRMSAAFSIALGGVGNARMDIEASGTRL